MCGNVFYTCKATTVSPGLLLYNLGVRPLQMPRGALSEVDNQTTLGILVLRCETGRFTKTWPALNNNRPLFPISERSTRSELRVHR